jgi:hypothetical protein
MNIEDIIFEPALTSKIPSDEELLQIAENRTAVML